jgi:hypothetical protein
MEQRIREDESGTKGNIFPSFFSLSFSSHPQIYAYEFVVSHSPISQVLKWLSWIIFPIVTLFFWEGIF